ncbi:response regulator, partial [Planctomycetota bacterium]
MSQRSTHNLSDLLRGERLFDVSFYPEFFSLSFRFASAVACDDDKRQAGEGYEIESTESGVEGLDLARSRDFDLVMTDLKMPDLDGMRIVEM